MLSKHFWAKEGGGLEERGVKKEVYSTVTGIKISIYITED